MARAGSSRAARARERAEQRQARADAQREQANAAHGPEHEYEEPDSGEEIYVAPNYVPPPTRIEFIEELRAQHASNKLVTQFRNLSDDEYLAWRERCELERQEWELREQEWEQAQRERKQRKREATTLGQIDLGDEGGPLLSVADLQQIEYGRKFREPGEHIAGVVVGISIGPTLVFGNGDGRIVAVEFSHQAAREAVMDVRPGDYVSAELLRRRGQEGATRHEFEVEHRPLGADDAS